METSPVNDHLTMDLQVKIKDFDYILKSGIIWMIGQDTDNKRLGWFVISGAQNRSFNLSKDDSLEGIVQSIFDQTRDQVMKLYEVGGDKYLDAEKV